MFRLSLFLLAESITIGLISIFVIYNLAVRILNCKRLNKVVVTSVFL